MSASESLCCCEYDNKHGERSHLLACCCDCEVFDQMADRCCKCQAIPSSLIDSFLDTLADRCRLPGFTGGGAIKIKLELATPLIVIPASLLLASIGPITTAVVLFLLPCFCLFFYTTWKRRTNKTRTKFFFVWGLTSLTFMYFLFEMIICANTHVDLSDNLIISVCVIVMCAALRLAKKDPGIIPKNKIDQYFYDSYAFFGLQSSDSVRQGLDEDLEDYEIVQMEETNSSDEGNLIPTKKGDNWCVSCNVEKPSRSGHCRVCDVCVANRDHHCVWIDSCVGAENHRAFLVAMTLFVCTSYYGSYVTLNSICGYRYNSFATCSGSAYNEFRFGLCFASACYTFLVASIMLVGLVHQFILISQNATSQEMHVASQQGDSWCAIYRFGNPYNHGFVQNWTDFFQKRRNFGSFETV